MTVLIQNLSRFSNPANIEMAKNLAWFGCVGLTVYLLAESVV